MSFVLESGIDYYVCECGKWVIMMCLKKKRNDAIKSHLRSADHKSYLDTGKKVDSGMKECVFCYNRYAVRLGQYRHRQVSECYAASKIMKEVNEDRPLERIMEGVIEREKQSDVEYLLDHGEVYKDRLEERKKEDDELAKIRMDKAKETQSKRKTELIVDIVPKSWGPEGSKKLLKMIEDETIRIEETEETNDEPGPPPAYKEIKNCPCGAKVQKKGIVAHRRTMKHLRNVRA